MFSEGKKPTKLPRKSSPELFSKLRGFEKKKSLISCLSGCGICKFCFKDSMPQKCINAWKIILKIFIVGWRVTRLMSTGNLLKLLCVVQGARFFREKKWPLSAHISGNVSCCQEVNLHLFTHLSSSLMGSLDGAQTIRSSKHGNGKSLFRSCFQL